MTAGEELGAIAAVIGHGLRRLAAVRADLKVVNLGATAIGTGITAPVGYGAVAVRHLREITHQPLTLAPDLISATWDCGPLVSLSGVLKGIAVDLSKICNDLRLLSSGPRAGLGELQLPARQAGSSLMPGKVNPVIPEVVNQVAFQVIGHDLTISLAAEAGQLQLNAFQPLIAYALSTNIRHLERACRTLTGLCVRDLTANSERMHRNVADSLSLATALTPLLGYAGASAVAKEALATGLPVPDLVRRRDLLTEPQLQAALDCLGVMRRPGTSPR
jgi:aspartate ammonia-lyase